MSDSVKVVVVGSPFANMAPLYEVDPAADVLLIVPATTAPFAPWDATAAAAPQKISKAVLASSTGLRIKASSKHLALASRVFRNKLQHANPKTSTQSDGRIHLCLAEGFAPKAVSIVLNAIHSRGSKVPRAVDLETLAQIALFVDRLQLYDAVEVYADRWISQLEDGISEAYDRELVLWLYASHVFRRAEVFKAVTKVAVAHSSGPLRDLGLPIREKIIRDIDTQRQALVSKSLNVLHSTLGELASGKASCSKFSCDSFLLGELVKTLHRNKVAPWPRPEKPFLGASHAAIVEAINSSAQFQWRNAEPARDLWRAPVNGTEKIPHRKRKSPNQQPITPESSPEPAARSGSSFDTHVCDARKLVGRFDELDGLEDGIVGLELESSLGFQRY
ncbi:hypothetical protein QBC34DRAFT_411719 [Podospora aff. communis PSN243]|uniref:BTB domain-containing protein n=1 Tax=Podospora aff. communis PSN243 TaxID=3040156 RepID=A0AAV9GDD1_9PEZI|nr:hypothetical protein QBC34DRAFT_411719 [Podospora aff. communis PSN243]